MPADPNAYAAALIRRLDQAEAAVAGPASQTIRAAVSRQRRALQDCMVGPADPSDAPLPAAADRPGDPTDQIAALAHAYAAAAAATRDRPGPLPELFDRFEREIEAIVTGA